MYDDMMSTDLYELAQKLDQDTSLCKRFSVSLWIFNIIQMVMPISFVLLLSIFDVDITRSILIYSLSFYVFHVFFRWLQLKELQIYKHVNRLYDILTDRVDWVDLRNKALYGTIDGKIVSPMNNFVGFSQSMLCVHEKGKNIFSFLKIISLLLSLLTIVISAFIDIF